MSIASPNPTNTPPTRTSTPTCVTEQVPSNRMIVIHPGSLFLRIGFASDSSPHSIYHVIARKNKSNNKKVVPHEDAFLVPTVALDKELLKTMIESEKNVAETLNSCLTSEGICRTATGKDKLIELNKKVKPVIVDENETEETTRREWTKDTSKRDVLIGDEVMLLKPNEPFHIRWPIRRGQLNVHSGLGGSITSVVSDLETIWSSAIDKYLGVSKEDLKNYRVVLVMPDVYQRNHIKHLLQLLLNRLQFSGCVVLQESVCATFGAGLAYACVVDCGDQKTSVTCVEDGFASRVTRITLDYGGSDLTQLFHHLLKQRAFPYTPTSSRLDGSLLHQLKESCCHLNLDVCGPQSNPSFEVDIPDQTNKLLYNFHVGDECLLTPLALFHPELLALTIPQAKRIRILRRNDGDSEDPFDENYLIQTKRKYGESSDVSGQAGDLTNLDQSGTEVIDDLDGCEMNVNEKEFTNDQQLLSIGIDQAILQCIDRCDSEEMKRRMYSCILLVGGGMCFTGIDKWLQSRLSMSCPVQYRGQQIDIISKPKDIDPKIVVWKGATVTCLLDTAREIWIGRSDWENSGVRVLREKASFVF